MSLISVQKLYYGSIDNNETDGNLVLICSQTSPKGDPPQALSEDKLEVAKLYRRRAPDRFIIIKEIQGGFNLDGLERDIIMTYISPKFKFEDPIEKEYHFRIPTAPTYVELSLVNNNRLNLFTS